LAYSAAAGGDKPARAGLKQLYVAAVGERSARRGLVLAWTGGSSLIDAVRHRLGGVEQATDSIPNGGYRVTLVASIKPHGLVYALQSKAG